LLRGVGQFVGEEGGGVVAVERADLVRQVDHSGFGVPPGTEVVRVPADG
jgi:hypothetical protein